MSWHNAITLLLALTEATSKTVYTHNNYSYFGIYIANSHARLEIMYQGQFLGIKTVVTRFTAARNLLGVDDEPEALSQRRLHLRS